MEMTGRRIVARRGRKRRREAAMAEREAHRGQATVELAMVFTVLVIVLLGAVQGAVVYNASLAVTQAAYEGARFAAVNPGYTESQIATHVRSVASPTISDGDGANLSVTIDPTTTPRAFGTPVKVMVSYNLQQKLVVPNPFFGIQFPTQLSGVRTAMSE
jgi:Flp pilus assembly protein TadG